MKKIPFYFPPINKLGNISFRRLCIEGGADYVFTEMIRTERILENEENALKKLKIPTELINKTFIQIISEDPNNIEKAIDKIMKLNPQIKEINYNMGCPQSSLCKKECGAGIIGNSTKVQTIAKILKKSCDRYNITPSIKIRLGLKRENITIYENTKKIQETGITKLYIHGRTLDDTYNKPATYEEIKKVKEMFPNMEIIANGDVKNINSLNKIIETNCDGILIGRAALEDPLIFSKLKNKQIEEILKEGEGINFSKRKKILIKFLEYAKKDNLSISQTKANLTYMTKNIIKANEYRKLINDTNKYDEMIKITTDF